MIIKSHVRGGYRAAADYLKEQGKNEKIRLVELSDPSAKNLDDAFHNMWVVSHRTKCTKPLHHISINPMKEERLTDAQVAAIVQRCEEKYGYKMFHHQRVIVEHVKDGRQHFHVIWNRVSLNSGCPKWPGHHWKKSKQVCREMEKELGLKRPTPRRMMKARVFKKGGIKLWQPAVSSGGPQATKPIPQQPLRIKPEKEAPPPMSAPFRPAHTTKGWPDNAVIDWEAWGHKSPPRFFAKWPELKS